MSTNIQEPFTRVPDCRRWSRPATRRAAILAANELMAVDAFRAPGTTFRSLSREPNERRYVELFTAGNHFDLEQARPELAGYE